MELNNNAEVLPYLSDHQNLCRISTCTKSNDNRKDKVEEAKKICILEQPRYCAAEELMLALGLV